MKCEFCDNDANVFFTQIVEGKSKKMNLCDSCADEQGVTSLENFKLADIIVSKENPDLSGGDKSTGASKSPKQSKPASGDVTCSDCGFTLDDLREIGRLGCSSCYATFSPSLEKMLTTMQRGAEHKGKVPEGMVEALDLDKKVNDLKSALEKAIKAEDYEKASKLSAELKEMEKLQSEKVS